MTTARARTTTDGRDPAGDAQPADRVKNARTSSMLSGFQKWRSLLFVHWAVPPSVVRPLVPDVLEIDTFGDPPMAYVGLIPFEIPELRVLRALPLRIAFLETNLRTYVRHRGERGVWFFSLEAESAMAVIGARAAFGLPYCRADMISRRVGDHVAYFTERRWPDPRPASMELGYQIGPAIAPPEPGSLAHFLIERYVLFARHPLAGLVRGEVRHRPYPLRTAHVERLTETLRRAAGISEWGERTADFWSEGVDVEIMPPRRLGPAKAKVRHARGEGHRDRVQPA